MRNRSSALLLALQLAIVAGACGEEDRQEVEAAGRETGATLENAAEKAVEVTGEAVGEAGDALQGAVDDVRDGTRDTTLEMRDTVPRP